MNFFDKELERVIKKGLHYLESKISSTSGIQFKFIGYSRSELNQPNLHPHEHFSSALVLDILENHLSKKSIQGLLSGLGSIPKDNNVTKNYFFDDNTTYLLPDDIDMTAMFYLCRWSELTSSRINQISQALSDNTTKDGIFQTYFPPRNGHEDRVDPCANANALRLLYKSGMKHNLKKTEIQIFQHLKSGKYLNGTRYYPSPDTFLYNLSRALTFDFSAKTMFSKLLTDALMSRMENQEYPLDSAQRILCLDALDLDVNVPLIDNEVNFILSQQCDDGGWPSDSMFGTGSNPVIYFGGREIPTAFAIASLISIQNKVKQCQH